MGLLNHLFGSKESIAQEIELDDESIKKSWKDYVETIPEKKKIIESLGMDNNLLNNLRKLLELELVDIRNEEREETELISDLEVIEHSQKVRRVHKLEQCLKYVETKYEYVYELLHQLCSILKSQIHLTEKLLAGSKNLKKLIAHLTSQLELELEIIKKIEGIETFHDLFSALVKGEHIIRVMDSKEKELLKRMQERLGKIFSNEIKEGITYEWVGTVFDTIEKKVDEGVANSILHYHQDSDVEYVNRPEFIDLVRETIQTLRKRKVSERMIYIFVHLFREWYNHEISPL